MPEKLPFAVRRGIVRSNWTSPPGCMRDWAKRSAGRLARIPPAVWELQIDWSKWASDLDHAALVQISARTPAQIQRGNDAAAAALRKAAVALRSTGQGELGLVGALQIQQKKNPGSVPAAGRLIRYWQAETEERLTLPDFLDTLADSFADRDRRLHGIHFFSGPARQGPQAAALEAACRVAALFERLLGRPCWDQVADVVHAYHPEAQEKGPDEWARAVNARKNAAEPKNNTS